MDFGISEKIDQSKGFLAKRKDFLGVDEEARYHPNRTYYFRKNNDIEEIIDSCNKRLEVCNVDIWLSMF